MAKKGYPTDEVKCDICGGAHLAMFHRHDKHPGLGKSPPARKLKRTSTARSTKAIPPHHKSPHSASKKKGSHNRGKA